MSYIVLLRILTEPEKSITYDLGSDIIFKESSGNLYIGAFETKVEDIIKFSFLNINNQLQTLKHMDLKLGEKDFNDFLSTNFNYTKTHGKNNNNITLSKDKIIFSNIKPKKIDISTSYLFQNKSKDTKYNELPTYRSLNLNAGYLFQKIQKLT